MKAIDRALLNAVVVAGIVFFSTMNVTYPPTMANVYASGTGAMLALLTQLKTLTSTDGEINIPKFGMLF